ncbi:hypothetical protein NPIL_529971, partial [Nephila pilipes]
MLYSRSQNGAFESGCKPATSRKGVLLFAPDGAS